MQEQSAIPHGLRISGDVTSSADLTIQGEVDGHVILSEGELAVAGSGVVRGQILARTVLVAGAIDGTIVASERVHLLTGAAVRAHVTAPSFAMDEGADFNGSVDPERTEIAMRVARYRERQRDEAG